MSYKGLVLEPDKRIREVEFAGLADLQAAVQGLIEPIDLTDNVTMYVNEEGMYQFTKDDVNWMACDVAGLGGRPEYMFRGLLGPAVLVGLDPSSGESIDLPDIGRHWVIRVAREAGGHWVTEEAS